MSNLVAGVRRQFDRQCLEGRETLRKQRCTVSLAQMPRARVVADLDRPGSPLGEHETRCDYLVFAEEGGGKTWKGWVVPLELKARLRVDTVAAQLQAGADAAGKLVADASDVSFVPVVAFKHKKGQERSLKDSRMRVKFKDGKSETFRLMKCGGKLIDILP